MNAKLLYVLFAFSGPSWHGSVDLNSSAQPGRCETIQAQLEAVPNNRKTYKCLTLVSTGSKW